MADVNNPRMVRIAPGQTYAHKSGRLFSERNALSFIIPMGSMGREVMESIFDISDDPALFQSTLYLHNGTDHLIRRWIDEDIRQGGEILRATEPGRPILGGIVRRFESTTFAAYRVKCDDIFGNGLAGIFRGPRSREADTRTLVRGVIGSLRFVQIRPMKKEDISNAVSDFAALPAQTNRDLTLYIDRYYYMLRDEVREGVSLLVRQAKKEAHPGLAQFKQRLELLDKCRELVLKDGWDELVADLRSGHEEL